MDREDTDADDLEPFEDHSQQEDALQDVDDSDPLAPLKPAFDPLAFERESQEEERTREERAAGLKAERG